MCSSLSDILAKETQVVTNERYLFIPCCYLLLHGFFHLHPYSLYLLMTERQSDAQTIIILSYMVCVVCFSVSVCLDACVRLSPCVSAAATTNRLI